MSQFDPYYVWLGIPPKDQPPNYYCLLGIERFEADPKVIESAADRQMAHVRTFQAGQHRDASQKILNELSTARGCLLVPETKAAYDRTLRPAAAPTMPVAAAPLPLPRPIPLAQPLPAPAVASPLKTELSFSRTRRHKAKAWWQQPAALLALGVPLMLVLALVVLLASRGRSRARPQAPSAVAQRAPDRNSRTPQPTV